jgi:cellulose synthase operon protein C
LRDRQPKLRSLVLPALLLLAGCDRFTSEETRMSRANASLESGKYQAAVIELRKVLDSKPDNLNAQLLLVDALSATGDAAGARRQLDLAIKAGASPSETEARALRLLLALGDREAMRKTLEGSTSVSAGERAMFEGRLLMLERKPTEAQAAFDRALAEDVSLDDAAVGRIEALMAQGRGSETRQAIDTFLARKPDNGRALIMKGTLATRSRDFTTAIQAFSTAIESGKGLSRTEIATAHAQRVNAYLSSGQLETARSALAGLVEAAGETPVVFVTRANVALAAKDPSTAVNELRKFTQAVPQYMPARMLLVSALFQQGSTEQAYAEAVRNVSEFSDSDEPRLALAEIESRLGRASDAEETLRPLVTRSPPNPLATATLAEIKMRRGESIAGASLLEQAVADQPGNPRLLLALAAAYLSQSDPNRALATLDRIEDKSQFAARDRLRVIATAAIRGPAAGEKELEAAIARHSGDVDLLLLAAAYQASVDHFDKSRSYLQKALEVRPDDRMLTLALARMELSAGRLDEAEALTRRVLDKVPTDASAMTLMAGIAARRGQEADVDAWLNRARIAQPGALDVSLALARRSAVRGNSMEARQILAEAVRNAPADPAARVALAELDASAGRHTEAMEGLREAAQKTPDSPHVLVSMAKIQLAAKDVGSARKTLMQALDLNPSWLPAAATLAALESNAGNLPAAIEVAKRLRRADPEGAASFALEGDIYMTAKRPRDAAAAYVAAYQRTPSATLATRAAQAKQAANISSAETELVDWLARAPDDAITRRTLAEFHSSRGQNAAAISELEKVISARPKDAVALNNLAWLYHQQKRDPRALTTAQAAYAVAPDVAAIADTYGWILAQSGKAKEALPVLEKAARLAPNSPEIQFHHAYALANSGDRARAADLLREALASAQNFGSRSEAQQLLKQLEQ